MPKPLSLENQLRLLSNITLLPRRIIYKAEALKSREINNLGDH